MTFCKTVEEAELTGRAGIKIFTYSWESLFGRQKKREICNYVQKYHTEASALCVLSVYTAFDFVFEEELVHLATSELCLTASRMG